MRYFDPQTNADPPSVSEPPSPFIPNIHNKFVPESPALNLKHLS